MDIRKLAEQLISVFNIIVFTTMMATMLQTIQTMSRYMEEMRTIKVEVNSQISVSSMTDTIEESGVLAFSEIDVSTLSEEILATGAIAFSTISLSSMSDEIIEEIGA